MSGWRIGTAEAQEEFAQGAHMATAQGVVVIKKFKFRGCPDDRFRQLSEGDALCHAIYRICLFI